MSDLKQLLESSMLNEESKAVISEAFDVAVQAKTDEIQNEYDVKLVEAKEELYNSAASMIEEAVSEELSSIKDEVVHARTLEVQYAEKLKMFKESYAEKQEEAARVQIAEAVAEEIAELKEDIDLAKKHEFAINMFESYKDVYNRMFGADDISVVDQLEEAQKELEALKRENKIREILESVSGNKRDVVMTLLESTPTDKLETRFESLRPLIIAESEKTTGEEQLDEGNTEGKGDEVKGTVVLETEENDDEPVTESSKKPVSALDMKLAKSLRLALNNQ